MSDAESEIDDGETHNLDEVPDPELFSFQEAGGVASTVLHYDGSDELDGIPTRAELVTGAASAGIARRLADGKPVFFMPNDIEETNDYLGGAPVYALRIFGVTPDGAKSDVTITGIEIFFDVFAGTAGNSNGTLALRQILADAEVHPKRLEDILAYPGRGFHDKPVRYTRVFTHNLAARKKALAAAHAAGLETASDDRSAYYRKAAREQGFPLSDWAVLHDYEYEAGPTERSPLCTHVFRVAAAGYRPLADPLGTPAARADAARMKAAAPLLTRDRTLVLAWDIETYSGRKIGDLPRPEHDADRVFMICVSAHWKDEAAPLCRVCIVDVETAPDPRWTTVVCGTQENVLRAFALCWRALAPDVAAGFNDSDYDWPFVVEKANRLRVLGWMFDRMSASPRRTTTDESVMRWNYVCDRKIKISAEEAIICNFLKVPGCVPIDVRICFKKLYPKSETVKAGSLKFYLEVSGLAGKADMPIKRMWQYYEEALTVAAAGAGATASADAAEHMRHVAHYCVIDSVRCQELLVRRAVLGDYREVATLAYVSIYDAHYYAGGMKVCNLLGAYAARRNILVSMVPNETAETGKYPGAYVFPPEKGLVPDPVRATAVVDAIASGDPDAVESALVAFATDRPVTGLDFSSLYPSLIMAYNLSSEKVILDPSDADALRAAGRDLHEINFPFNGRDVRAWTVRHGNRPEDMGLYGSVLIDLFNKRAELKTVLGAHAAVKEVVELARGRAGAVSVVGALREIHAEAVHDRDTAAAALAPGAPPLAIPAGSTAAEALNTCRQAMKGATDLIKNIDALLPAVVGSAGAEAESSEDADAGEKAIAAAYDAACFGWTCANSKQLALKVYMNTFYGETGNSKSPFFLLPVAGGVTSAGQYNIKMVADFVRTKGYILKYGDTDSLYLVCPKKYFAECDADFAAGRIDRHAWYSAMVRVTMRALTGLRDEVNAELRRDNGTPYLKMAYEEVLYPVVFTGKKKYYGIPHTSEVNFRPPALFIRGIDVVKQGQPGLAREIGYRIMWAGMAVDNARTIRQIVEDVLGDAVRNGTQWEFDHFIKTDAWKPLKNNIPVQRFIARMRERLAAEDAANARLRAAGETPLPRQYELPEPGERFSYVLVVPPPGSDFDLFGRKTVPKKGDRMAFARVARAQNLEVDVAFYMVSYVVGLCARFINADFAGAAGATAAATAGAAAADADDAASAIDEKSQKLAKKYLEEFIRSIRGGDPERARKQGVAYRRAFAKAVAVGQRIAARSGTLAAELLQGSWVDFGLILGGDNRGSHSAAVDALWLAARRAAEANVAKFPYAAVARRLQIGPAGEDLDVLASVQAPQVPAQTQTKSTNLFRACAGGAGAGGAGAGGGAAARRPTGGIIEAYARALMKHEAAIRARLLAAIPAAAEVAAQYETTLLAIVDQKRCDEHTANPDLGQYVPTAAGAAPAVLSHNAAALEALYKAWQAAVTIEQIRCRSSGFDSFLQELKKTRLRLQPALTAPQQAVAVAEAAAAFRPIGGITVL